MRRLAVLLVVGVSLFAIGQARGQYRSGAVILVKHDKVGKPQVTIRSEVKSEQRESVSVDEACRVISAMKTELGVSVAIAVVTDRNLHGSEAKKLLNAILDHGALTLNYVGSEMPKVEPGQIGEDEDILEFASRDPMFAYVARAVSPKAHADALQKHLKDISRPWTVAKILKHYHEEERSSPRRGLLLGLLAISRDARGIVAVGEASSKDAHLVLLLQGTIAPLATGGTEAQIIAAQKWWAANQDKIRRRAKELESKPQRERETGAVGSAPASALPGPWGESVKGLRCRITKLEPAETKVTVTIELQNHSEKSIKVLTGPKTGGRSDSYFLSWSFFEEFMPRTWTWTWNSFYLDGRILPESVLLEPGKSLLRTFRVVRTPGSHLVIRYQTSGGSVLTGSVPVAADRRATDDKKAVYQDQPGRLSWYLGDTMMAPAAPRKQPKEEGGLELEVEFGRKEYLLGEPIWVRCSLVNTGKKAITISYGRYEPRNTIVVDIDNGEKRLQRRPYERDSSGPQPLTILPGWRLVEWYNLVDEYLIGEPGEYTARVRYEGDGKSFNAGTLHTRTNLWKGKLEQPLGAFTVNRPASQEDRAALESLVISAKHPDGYENVDLLHPADRPRFEQFLSKHGNSRYAIHARYSDALGALRSAKSTLSGKFAQPAIGSLGAIDPKDLPPLLAERRLFHLIQAHELVGSKRQVIDGLIFEFLAAYPQSPYVSVLKESDP